MLKHLIVAAVSLSSLAIAGPHRAQPVAVPPPPAPVMAPVPDVARGPFFGASSERSDVARAQRLVNELDNALARREFRRVQLLDNQMQAFLQSELAESQGVYGHRDHRGAIRQVRALQSQLASLSGRFDWYSMQSRRNVYNQAVSVAMSDVQRGNGRVYGRR